MSRNKGTNQNDKIKMPFKEVLSHNWFIVKIIFSTSPLFGIMLILEPLRQYGFNFIEHTFGIGFVLETVEFGRDFKDVLYFMLIMFGLLAFSGVYSAVFNSVITPIYVPRIERNLKLRLYKKAKSLDLACYDDPDYYNEFVLAVTESKNSLDRTIQLVKMTFGGLVMFLSYGTYFLVKDRVSVLFVIISFVARFVLASIVNKIQYRVRLKENPLIKRRNYIHRVFYLNDYAKELRLNKKTSEGLYKDFEETNNEIYRINKEVAKKKWGIYFLIDYLFRDFITDGLYLTYLVFKVTVQHVMSFSALVVLYNSAGGLRRGMSQLTDLFPFAMETALYVKKIRGFLDYEAKIVSVKKQEVLKKPAKICFENVSFSYTESGKKVLNNVNFTIEPNEKVALVGYNGAGKTTLVKLLMRLYDPTEGRITVDGKNIKDYDVDEYRERIGTVFQDYKIYAASVEENILMDLADYGSDEKIMESALRNSGFYSKLKEMDNGIKTQLTREFDESGTGLSGGESQKLAIARVFYKECDTIILDEPSSALDPIAEYQLNHSMTKASKDKSVIFISHRLSTTRHADKIFMLEKGSIIEEGTHEELVCMDGKYAQMWNAQASKYL